MYILRDWFPQVIGSIPVCETYNILKPYKIGLQYVRVKSPGLVTRPTCFLT
jgi:hypothetical protein